jgi:hypothetical protein
MQQLALVHFLTPIRNPAKPEQLLKSEFTSPEYNLARSEAGLVAITSAATGETLKVSGLAHWFIEAPVSEPEPIAKKKAVSK